MGGPSGPAGALVGAEGFCLALGRPGAGPLARLWRGGLPHKPPSALAHGRPRSGKRRGFRVPAAAARRRRQSGPWLPTRIRTDAVSGVEKRLHAKPARGRRGPCSTPGGRWRWVELHRVWPSALAHVRPARRAAGTSREFEGEPGGQAAAKLLPLSRLPPKRQAAASPRESSRADTSPHGPREAHYSPKSKLGR